MSYSFGSILRKHIPLLKANQPNLKTDTLKATTKTFTSVRPDQKTHTLKKASGRNQYIITSGVGQGRW